MGRFAIGQSYRRTEDQRLITGAGRYTDDITPEGTAYVHFVRSTYAHGTIKGVDLGEAEGMPGVLGIYTISDLDAAGINDLPVAMTVADVNGREPDPLPRSVLARDRVRYVGEPVVAVVAETRAIAEDAAEQIFVDIDELPAVASLTAAVASGAEELFPEQCPNNVYAVIGVGDQDATDDAFEKAAHIVDIDLVNNRLAPNAMEPRGCVASFDTESNRYLLQQGTQGVHLLRMWACMALGIDQSELRVLTDDVGGGFGMRFYLQNEPVVALFAAKALGRPIKWMASRTESFLSDVHGRDNLVHAELAMDEGGRFTGLRVSLLANIGAYAGQTALYVPYSGAPISNGSYDIPNAYVELKGVVTNTVVVDAYRGAGRPEAIYMIERLVDKAARTLGIAPDELRRRNFIKEFPHKSTLGLEYDSGDYISVLNNALTRAEWDSFEKRRETSAAAGKLRGIGLAYYTEVCASASDESPQINIERDGTVVVSVGTQATGQGHETTFAQMIAEELNVPIGQVRILQGDSDDLPWGNGTGGSRSIPVGASAVTKAIELVVEQASILAGDALEVDSGDLQYDAGTFTVVGTNLSIGLAELVERSYANSELPEGVVAGLGGTATFASTDATFPNGAHICEVEVDPETGTVDVQRYTVEDDVGTVINPLLLEGQVMGGVAQGIGQALYEHAVYDEGGQLLTGSFMDYTMPLAADIPGMDHHCTPSPSPRNPIGAKGAGEAGTIGATPAAVNAVLNALTPVGVKELDMPLTPHAVWQAIQSASAS